jgi:hypothetical protein
MRKKMGITWNPQVSQWAQGNESRTLLPVGKSVLYLDVDHQPVADDHRAEGAQP